METSLGRIKTLAISTLATSLGTLVFVLVDSQPGIMLSSMLVSLAATLMCKSPSLAQPQFNSAALTPSLALTDAVIYAYTPEAFPTSTRGTACGIASALSRLAGIIAPIVTGLLLSINVSAPLFLSSVCFFITAGCAAILPIETRVKGRRGTVMAAH